MTDTLFTPQTPGVRAPAHPGTRPASASPLAGRPTHRTARRALTAATCTAVALISTAAALTGDPTALFAALSLLPFLTTRTDRRAPRRRPAAPDPIDDYMPAWWYLP